MAMSREARAQLLLHFSAPKHWSSNPVAACCPPGTLLSSIAQAWHEGSSIPLELPVAMSVTIISGELAARNIRLQCHEADPISPEIWYAILAPAGCGKSWTLGKLREIFGRANEIEATGCVSTAALYRKLSEKSRGWWACDEWGHFLKQIEAASSPLSEAKPLLLRIYSGDSVSREKANCDDGVVVENPAMALCGVTVDETFRRHISEESLLDGFGSRFAYAYGSHSDARPWHESPTWRVEVSPLREAWEQISSRLLPAYKCPDAVLSAFETGFRRLYRNLIDQGFDVLEAFFRRCLHRHHKLALLGHCLSNPDNPELTTADYDAAERLVAWQLRDGRKLIEAVAGGDLHDLLSRACAWADLRRAAGKSVTRRDLIAGVRGVRNASDAEFLLRCIFEPEPLLAKANC